MYRTCIGCRNQGRACETRDAVRAQLAGLGVTSIKWKCKARVPKVVVGQPVWALTVESVGTENRDYFPGIACGERGTKMLVYIEKGALGRHGNVPFEPRERGYCKIPISRIEPREGEIVRVCKRCCNPAMKCQCGEIDGW